MFLGFLLFLAFNLTVTAWCGFFVGARCKQWETAVALLREMTQGGARAGARGRGRAAAAAVKGLAPGLVSYGAAIHACATCGEGDAAVALLREMPIVGITPDARSYTSAISACGRAGQVERAVGLFREIGLLRVGFRPDAVSYSAALAACGDGGRWEEALRCVRFLLCACVPITPAMFCV